MAAWLETRERFDPESFVRDCWQKRPLLARRWLSPRPLTEGQLRKAVAGEGLASRLVRGRHGAGDWSVNYGPFSGNEIPDMSHSQWTLLVHDLDKTFFQVNEILDAFRFLPGWLVDDVMVSLAGPDGSVGPHVDTFDVFLVQAAGRRRWQLARDFDPTLDARFELAVLENFAPEEEILVEPGDVLYLPPGIAHHGVALEAGCQTWSVGLRAPSAAELLAELAARMAGENSALPRLNPQVFDPANPHIVGQALLEQARGLLRSAVELDDEALSRFLGCAVTGYRLCEPGEENGLPADSADFNPPARLAWSSEGVLYVNGEAFDCPPDAARAACATRRADGLPAELIEALRDLGALG